MSTNYGLTRVAGGVHSGGNILFSSSDVVFSAMGNRVSYFDLRRNESNAVAFEARNDIDRLVLSSDGVLLVAIDIEGRLMAVNVPRRVVLHRLNLKARCLDAKISHDDGVLAVTHERLVQLWLAPARRRRELLPFTKIATFGGATGATTCLRWSPDSKRLAVGAEDATIRIYIVEFYEGGGSKEKRTKETRLRPFKLAAHKDSIVAVLWLSQQAKLLSIAKDCVAAAWDWRENIDEEWTKRSALWVLEQKHFLWAEGKSTLDEEERGRCELVAADCCTRTGLVACAFSTGVFAVYDASEDFTCVHRLSAARGAIDAIAIDQTKGEWIALGSSRFGQLAVWEWRAETFALKQQGHDHEALCAAWAPDGRIFASGGADHKVKLWSDASGFCFATFADHGAPVTAVAFAGAKSSVLFSASRDGTVQAYDVTRYRNFRTFKAPPAARQSTDRQRTEEAGPALTCLAVDKDGEIVCAGSDDPYEIYVWATRTGNLLDALAGHTGPLSGLGFDPTDMSTLSSCSWDKTVRLWNVYRNDQVDDPLEHPAEVLALAFRHDGKRLCCAALDGCLHVWDHQEAKLLAIVDAKPDLFSTGGRRGSLFFDSLAYSVDGKRVLAGGRSRFVCVFAIDHGVLLKKFPVSVHRQARTLLNDDDGDGPEQRHTMDDDEDALPGAKRARVSGALLAQSTGRVAAVAFSPTGRSFVAVVPAAILVFSVIDDATFAPFDVDVEVTPAATVRAIQNDGEPSKALAMALQLGDDALIDAVVKHVSLAEVPIVVKGVPQNRAPDLLRILASRLDTSPHVEFYLIWLLAVLRTFPENLNDPGALRTAQYALLAHQRTLTGLCDDNDFALSFLCASS